MTAAETTVVCVLGMSRSGTSLTARALNLAGVYLGGEEELLSADLRQLPEESRDAAREANPAGFWEHYPMMRLNERILRRLGGSWRQPPALPAGWESSEELRPEREEARSLLGSFFSGHALWGWKDPRNSLTLPFWKALLPRMRYVVCLRNPLDVAGSLARRDGMPFETALDLHRAYLLAALRGTAGEPRLLVPYEAFMLQPPAYARRLARFVGREGAFERDEDRRRIERLVDGRLWRHRTAVREVARDARLPDSLGALYLSAERLAAAAPDGLPAADPAVAELAEALDARVAASA